MQQYLSQKIDKPDVLYDEVIEVKERLVLVQDKCEISYPHHGVVSGKSDVKVNNNCHQNCTLLQHGHTWFKFCFYSFRFGRMLIVRL